MARPERPAARGRRAAHHRRRPAARHRRAVAIAWTTPITAIANAALTAAQWNATVRDNLNLTAPALATTAGSIFVATGTNALAQRIPSTAVVNASESTTNSAYTDLATVGPQVASLTTGTSVFLAFGAVASLDTTGARCHASFAVTGASSVSGSDNASFAFDESGAGRAIAGSRVYMQTALTAGTNTFTMKYHTAAGTTGTWSSRNLVVIPW